MRILTITAITDNLTILPNETSQEIKICSIIYGNKEAKLSLLEDNVIIYLEHSRHYKKY